MVKFKGEIASMVKEVGSISIEIFKNNFIDFVKETLQNIDQNQDNKIDRSLLRLLCNYLESTYKKKNIVDEKLDKKKLVIDVYCLLKPSTNNETDKKILDALIEDLHNTGQIKKISLLRRSKKNLSSLLKSLVSWL